VSWLNPSILWLLALALAPLLLHLVLRQKVRRVMFSAVRFLASAGHDVLVRRRWLEWLLAGVRTVCIVLLVAGFARPFFAGGREDAAAVGSRAMLVVMLDVSRSMSRGSVFSEALDRAQRIINENGADRDIRIVTFSDAGSVSIRDARDAGEAMEILRQASPGGAGTDIVAALTRTISSLGAGRDGQVHLVSDLQATAIERRGELPHLPHGFSMHVHAVGGNIPADSLFVSGKDAFLEIQPGENNLVTTVRIANRGRAGEADVELRLNDKPISTRRVRLPQNGQTTVDLRATIAEPGEYAGCIIVKGPPPLLDGDDRFHFVVRVVEKIRVAVINGHPARDPAQDAAFYVAAALGAGADSPFRAETFEKLPADPSPWNAVVLAAVERLPEPDIERLARYVDRGGGLIVSVGPGMDIAAFNASLGRLLPARLRGIAAEGERLLVAADRTHPLVRNVTPGGRGDFGREGFRSVYELKDSQDAHVILRFDDGRPALLEKTSGAGRILMFAGCLDRRTGNFPLRAIFVPFMREAVRSLCGGRQRSCEIVLGAPLRLPAGVRLARPDGSTAGGDAEVTLASITQPGIYRLISRDGEQLHAVNGDAAESDLRPAVAADVERAVSPAQSVEIRATASGIERVLSPAGRQQAERRWNIGWWCVLAAAVLTLAELWLAGIVSEK